MNAHRFRAAPAFDLGEGKVQPDPDIMRTGLVDAQVYVDDGWYEAERDIFRSAWLYAGRATEISRSGDWFVRDYPFAPASVILIRDGATVRAFHNVCSHRGMRLAREMKGRGGRLSCCYHGWTYNGAGDLIGLPRAKCFPFTEKEENGLTPVACDLWEGFIFIHLDPSPRLSLREFLGPLADRLSGVGFDQYPLEVTMSDVVEGNWKCGLEASSEAYHVKALHPSTLGNMLVNSSNAETDWIELEFMGPHRMGTVPRNVEYEVPPSRTVAKFAAVNASGMLPEGDLAGRGAGEGLIAHPNVNRSNAPDFGSDQYFVFPNMSIVISINGWWTTTYTPIDRGKFVWEIRYFYKKPKSLREEFSLTAGVVYQRDLVAEDNVCFGPQVKMLESGAKKICQFGEPEILVRHLHAVMASAISQRRRGQ